MTAVKPCGQQGAVAEHLLSPVTISFTKEAECAYRAGLIHPTAPLPMAMRAALILEMKPATTGHDADVPAMPAKLPPYITR